MLAVFIQYQRVTDRQTDGRTDRRTDRIAISISRVSTLMTRDKNEVKWSVNVLVCLYMILNVG